MDVVTVPIASLQPHPDNAKWRTHPPEQVAELKALLEQFGWLRNVVVSSDGYIIAGHGITTAAQERGETEVPVVRMPWPHNDPRCLKFMVAENTVQDRADTDETALASLLADLQRTTGLEGTGHDDASLDAMIANLAAEEFAKTQGGEAGGQEDGEDGPALPDVVEAMFPSDNDFGIPTLLLEMQADAPTLPVAKWGTTGRRSSMPGTWHFYTDDYKFTGLWASPDDVIATGAYACVEPNISTYPGMPLALAYWQTYQKRWLSRWWQQYGVRIIVDLNVEPHCAAVNLLGVPQGWKAYCTRWADEDAALVMADYETAKQHCGGEPMFCVYGGGAGAVAACREHGWVHLPERMRELEANDGQGHRHGICEGTATSFARAEKSGQEGV